MCVKEWEHVSAGGSHTAAIGRDGSLWAWGSNSMGRIGDGAGGGNGCDRHSPVRIDPLQNWEYLSVGTGRTIAIDKLGNAYTWGTNWRGELGLDELDLNWMNINYRNSPAHIMSLAGSVSVGGMHTAAIRRDGSLWTWGANWSGQVGDGTGGSGQYSDFRYIPTQIGTDTNWASVSVGSNHTAAIRTDGSLWAWGSNNSGQLGDGTTTDRNTPTRIGTDTNWAYVSAGGSRTIAIRTNGSLWSWGHDAIISPADTNWASVSTSLADSGATLAIRTDGSLWAWGRNTYGQFGNGTTNIFSTPPTRIGTDTDWVSVSLGERHSTAIRRDGTLWAWGSNTSGQLGDGTTTNRYSPVMIRAAP